MQSGGAQSRGAQGGFDLVRRQGQHPEAMPILRLPVEPAKSPARLQLREQSGAFLGTQELGEDVPDLPLDVGAELPGDFREGERESVVFESDHERVGRKGSPVASADLAGDGGDAFGGQAPHRAQELDRKSVV